MMFTYIIDNMITCLNYDTTKGKYLNILPRRFNEIAIIHLHPHLTKYHKTYLQSLSMEKMGF